MTYYDSGICFVCSHFAAHRENVVGRNQDFHSIVSKTSFDVGPAVVKEGVASGSIGQWREGDEGKIGVMDHDVVWWLGDLNYRIDEGMGTEEVFEKAQRGDIEVRRGGGVEECLRFEKRGKTSKLNLSSPPRALPPPPRPSASTTN